MYRTLPRTFFDSHRTFKPFTIEKAEGETVREYDRRADKIYNELVKEHETPANGNRVYMRYNESK